MDFDKWGHAIEYRQVKLVSRINWFSFIPTAVSLLGMMYPIQPLNEQEK